jgi:hypothetical protein
MRMSWDIEATDEFVAFFRALSDDQGDALEQRIDLLEQEGPRLRRPIVGEIKGSDNDPRMKELRCDAGGHHLRVLFVFDPRRTAILLVGGSKTGEWKEWYRRAIPQADKLYEEYLRELRKEGLI